MHTFNKHVDLALSLVDGQRDAHPIGLDVVPEAQLVRAFEELLSQWFAHIEQCVPVEEVPLVVGVLSQQPLGVLGLIQKSLNVGVILRQICKQFPHGRRIDRDVWGRIVQDGTQCERPLPLLPLGALRLLVRDTDRDGLTDLLLESLSVHPAALQHGIAAHALFGIRAFGDELTPLGSKILRLCPGRMLRVQGFRLLGLGLQTGSLVPDLLGLGDGFARLVVLGTCRGPPGDDGLDGLLLRPLVVTIRHGRDDLVQVGRLEPVDRSEAVVGGDEYVDVSLGVDVDVGVQVGFVDGGAPLRQLIKYFTVPADLSFRQRAEKIEVNAVLATVLVHVGVGGPMLILPLQTAVHHTCHGVPHVQHLIVVDRLPLEDQPALIPGEKKEHREMRVIENHGQRLDASSHLVCHDGELREGVERAFDDSGVEVRVGEHASRSSRVLASRRI